MTQAALPTRPEARLGPWLARWHLVPDGPVSETHAAYLCPVRRNDTALMLKLALSPEEEAGGALLDWWDGDGAVMVRARESEALLMDRAKGTRDLATMAWNGADAEATLILATLLKRLHAPRPKPPPPLRPLSDWFADLFAAASRDGGLFVRAAEQARALFDAPQPPVALHGDLHHGNVLKFGRDDWRAIDPKGLWGEPAYDVVPLLLNPDLADPGRPIATRPGRLAARVATLAPPMDLDPCRILRWTAAGSALSAAWSLLRGDRTHVAVALSITEAAFAELDR